MTDERARALSYIANALQAPLAIMPEKLAVIFGVLEGRIGVDASDMQTLVDERLLAYVTKPKSNRFVGDVELADPTKPYGKIKPYRTQAGTAIINVVGSLVNRGAWVGSKSGMTSYEGLTHQLQTAARDPSIKSIVLDIDSPGGEAVGAFEVGALVAEVNKTKRVVAHVNGLCCSAAYAIASGASRIEATSTSIVGSIGVVMSHFDQSARIHQMGIKPTLIFAGAHKVDGNPLEPLSAETKARMQEEVNKFYEKFVQQVVSGRKAAGMTAKMVRDTEARTYVGSDAVSLKLVDAIATFDATLGGIHRRSKTGMTMEPIFTQAQHDQLVASAVANARTEATAAEATRLSTEHAAAIAAARIEGATAERQRINAILGMDEAQGREAMARTIATTTSLSVDEAKPLLAAAPKAAPAAGGPVPGIQFGANSAPPKVNAASIWDDARKEANERSK
jgi:signal peptide peptidase SppA